MQNKNKTLVKSMDVLQLFLQHSRLSLNEMAELSGRPKTSVHRMVGSLEEMGFLQKDESGRYRLGLVFLQYGQLVADRLDIRQIALPVMQTLRDQVDEAVNLIVKDGDQAIYIEKLDTLHPVRLYTKIGRRSPLYAGACSRIILAYLDEAERERYLRKTELIPIATGTITDKQQLRQILSNARTDGYTISYSELEENTAAVAAPIFDHKGRLCAGLSIAGPDVRFGAERLPALISLLQQAARQISAELGWNGQNIGQKGRDYDEKSIGYGI
ncbi:IclR family transcriptional regulator domain-containing protein [Brevibacillus fulvus]|uniref:IclR family transcriptional regulator domain-containing protein n=1 Tax=Brevibacillus fulvus TaxID=1125967 RepID=UPI00195C951B